MGLMRNMSHNIRVFFLVLVAFLMFAATMGGTAQGFSIKMFTILSSNLTLAEKHQTLTQISKARALDLQAITTTNSSETLVPNTIRSPVQHAFSGFFYTEIYIGTPQQKANLAIDTGSTPTWVQSKECRDCFIASSPSFDFRKSTSFRLMASNDPICVPPILRQDGRGCSYDLEYADGTSTKGVFALEKFTFLSEQGQQAITNVAFGVGTFDEINFYDRYNGHPNPIIGTMGLGRGESTSILRQQSQITLQRFSYCLPPQFEAQPSLLHFGNDAQFRDSTNVPSTQILDGPHDYYYVRLNAISFNGQPLPIDPNFFMKGGTGIVVDSGSPYSVIVRDAFEILRQSVVDYFYNMYHWLPVPEIRVEFDLCYGNIPTVFTSPSIMLHLEGGNLELHKPTLFEALETSGEFCMTILSRGDNAGPNILGAAQQVNHRFVFDVGARRLSFAPEDC